MLEHVGVAFRADPLGEHQRADVGGLPEDAGGGVRHHAVVPGVADGDAAHVDRAGDLQHLVGVGQPVLDRRRGGDDLVHRARLERRGHRQVAQLPVLLPADVLARVEGVVVRHRQHLTGFRVEHHRGDVLRAGDVLGLLHLLLDVELDVVVEGQLDRRAVDRVVAVAVAAGDHHAVGAAVVGDRTVGAGQHGVQRVLEAEQPVAVPVDAADDVGRQRAARVLAQVLAFGRRPRGTSSMIASAIAGSTARAR